MREIFESATATVTWRGDATPLSRTAFGFLYAVPVPDGKQASPTTL